MREYPYKLYASVILLDGKIENWKVGFTPKNHPYEWTFKEWTKFDRVDDYVSEVKEFTVNNDEEHAEVFDKKAPEWFEKWEHADDYWLNKAY